MGEFEGSGGRKIQAGVVPVSGNGEAVQLGMAGGIEFEGGFVALFWSDPEDEMIASSSVGESRNGAEGFDHRSGA